MFFLIFLIVSHTNKKQSLTIIEFVLIFIMIKIILGKAESLHSVAVVKGV